MILAITIINNFGKCRFMKLYREHMVRSASWTLPARELSAEPPHCAWPLLLPPSQAEQQQQVVVKELFSTLNTRPDGVCNFIDASKWFGKGARIVYRQYATLFFIFAIDASESELGILDLIQARAPRLAPHGGTVERWAGRRVGSGEGEGEARFG
jgi:hypothetical protein